MKRRRGRKRVRGSRMLMPKAVHSDARWSLDFRADSFGDSRKFRLLAALDDCCRQNLCLIQQHPCGRDPLTHPARAGAYQRRVGTQAESRI